MLVHAGLIFEHVGLSLPLENALSLVAPGGGFSAVLQLPSEEGQDVASTSYTSMQTLKQDFALIDTGEFQRVMEQKGFHLVEQDHRTSPAGKTLWLGVFAGHLDQRRLYGHCDLDHPRRAATGNEVRAGGQR